MNDCDCDRFTQQMWLYLSGELTDVERARWEAHLKTCSRCRTALEDTQDTLARFDAAPALSASPAAVESVLAAASGSVTRRSGFWKPLRPILAVAAVIALFLGNAESPLFGRPVIESRSRDFAASHRVTALDAVFSVPTAATDPESVRRRPREIPEALKPLQRLSRSYWIARYLPRPTPRNTHQN